MSSDDRPSADPPEAQLVTVETTALDLPVGSVPLDTVALIRAFRQLQRLIPEFIQLSLQEQRSMARTGHLDPEFIDSGIVTACAAEDEAPTLTGGMTGEECRELAAEIARGAEFEREIEVVLKGVASANLRKRYRLGRAILNIYSRLGMWMNTPQGRYNHLRPHYDAMKRAYMKRRKTRRKTKTEKPDTPTE